MNGKSCVLNSMCHMVVMVTTILLFHSCLLGCDAVLLFHGTWKECSACLHLQSPAFIIPRLSP